MDRTAGLGTTNLLSAVNREARTVNNPEKMDPSEIERTNNIKQVSKSAKIRNRYNQVPHLNQDTNGKMTNSPLYTSNKSQEGSTFPAGDHKIQINKRAQRHIKHKTEHT